MTKYIRIGIGDKNENPPYFDQAQYESEVNEDVESQNTVISATAKHKSDFYPQFPYQRTKGLTAGTLRVKNDSFFHSTGPLASQNRNEVSARHYRTEEETTNKKK